MPHFRQLKVTKNHGYILVSLKKSLLLTYILTIFKTFAEIIVQQCLGYVAEIKLSGSSVFPCAFNKQSCF